MTLPFEAVELQIVPDADTFDEEAYLAANPDVAAAVAARKQRSGRKHFETSGRTEGRRQFARSGGSSEAIRDRIRALRAAKLAVLEPLFRRNPRSTSAGGAVDFLDPAVRTAHSLDDVSGISENPYDAETVGLIEQARDGLVLDVGAGLRPTYYSNVVNYEIAGYETTDVIGIGEDLPFQDDTFDGVLSIAVLEHVKDPFRCAAEIARVLKPRRLAEMLCPVPSAPARLSPPLLQHDA